MSEAKNTVELPLPQDIGAWSKSLQDARDAYWRARARGNHENDAVAYALDAALANEGSHDIRATMRELVEALEPFVTLVEAGDRFGDGCPIGLRPLDYKPLEPSVPRLEHVRKAAAAIARAEAELEG